MDIIEEYREKELKNLSLLKVILMIIIIFYHSILAWGDNFEFLNVTSSSKILYYIQQFTTSYHTRCFTIISGYLFFFLKHEKGKYTEFGPFVFNKFKRLIIPYLFVGLIFVVPLGAYARGLTYQDRLVQLLLGKSADQLWFLLMLFLEFVIFYLFDKFIYKKHLISFIIGFLFLGVGYLLKYYDISYFDISGAFMYFLFFLIGYKLRQLGSKRFYDVKAIYYILYYVVILALFIVSKEVEFFKDKSYISTVIYASMFITNGPIMFILLQKLANKIDYEKSKVYNFIKNKTFTMYLFHQQFIYLFIMATLGMKCAELNALIVFILTFISSLIITLIMQSNKFTRFLVGEK